MLRVQSRQSGSAADAGRDCIIASAYMSYGDMVIGYIRKRIGNGYEAEDLKQEVFMRLLENSWMIDPSTVKSLIFTIAHNIVVDWMRRNAFRIQARDYFFIHSPGCSHVTEETVRCNELERIEGECLRNMPQRRAEVYLRYIYKGESADDISTRLDLSKRTVEKHIFDARRDMKAAFSKAI